MRPGRATTIVVPCFNEAARLPIDQFRQFVADHPDVRFVFVDDGSSDGTAALLGELAQGDGAHFELVQKAHNRGKAEAVREGVLHVLAASDPPAFVGYWDADLATPLEEIPRFVAVLTAHPERRACFGSRVQLLGRTIERKALRHYLGRVFATVASLVLDLAVYDTQCGAKLFRDTPALRQALAEPFRSRWAFDVELIGRLTGAASPLTKEDFLEVPLGEWHDKRGSKLAGPAMLKAGMDVLGLGADVAIRGKRAFYRS
jgi:dolichyl-phosphate beta-glucosyltransferase